MLNMTHIAGERIVALFPCVGKTEDGDSYIVDATVVTTNEDDVFSVRRVDGSGEQTFVLDSPETLAGAIRTARQSLGWG
jgi:hypothetical protein